MDKIKNILGNIIRDKKKMMIILGVFIFIIVLILIFIFFGRISNDKYVYGGKISNDIDKYKDKIITNYDEYVEIINYYNLEKSLNVDDFNNNNYVMIVFPTGMCNDVNKISSDLVDNNNIEITIDDYMSCENCSDIYSASIYFVSIDKKVIDDDYIVTYIYNTEYSDKCNHG